MPAQQTIASPGRKRRTDLDLVCGIMIIHMIVGHIVQWADVKYHGDTLLFFFMPWFFYKSGMFFKKNEDWQAQLKKDARHLLIPLLSFSLIGQLFLWIHLVASGDMNWLHYVSFPKWLVLCGSIPANLPLWFLCSLFIVKTAYNAVAGRINDYLLVVVAVTVAFVFHLYDIDTPCYLANGTLGLVFYILGSKLRELQYGKYIFIAALVIYAISLAYPSNIGMFNNSLLSGYYLAAIVCSLAGILVLNKASKILCSNNIMYNALIVRCITRIGGGSMNYYATHWVLLMAVKIVYIDILGNDTGMVYFGGVDIWGDEMS